ncbi:hypothetical protein GGX14DRAFT_600065 [Mycena pura]|uniref:Uncharacterized protein n=1 Tax=Mycena pura TaxID=153505 RepID=A0AAD6US26_9AGAR|nr:hypothetical protein GGX14DRAFT_600065 [Mycena pura]
MLPGLPPYSYSPPVPSYSLEPAPDEETVELTGRAAAPPTGNYIKTCGRDAVVLDEQQVGAEFPTYGRSAPINGHVAVEDRETVSEIVLKINGKMRLMIAEDGHASESLASSLIDESYTLWPPEKSHTSTCPGAVPFSVVLPTQYKDENLVAHSLPPSYEIRFDAVSFKSSYTISVVITRMRRGKFQFLHKSETIPIKFTYSPRMRPRRPIQPSSNFLFDVKMMPEEFRQVVWEITPSPESSAEALDLHLFIPSVEVFGLEDTIPFHVQLSGPVASLRQFFANPGSAAPVIAVKLVRLLSVSLKWRVSRSFVIGTARLSASPPGFSSEADAGTASLDWDGGVRCQADTLVGMFDTGGVRVRDFFLVKLLPPRLQTKEEFTTLSKLHPIKLVTDSWLDASSFELGTSRESAVRRA